MTDFPLPNKLQIFNCEVKDFKKLFKYPVPSELYLQLHPEEREIFVHPSEYWCIDEYGDDWYNHLEFWIEFLDVAMPFDRAGCTLEAYTEQTSKEFVIDFFRNFKEQIDYTVEHIIRFKNSQVCIGLYDIIPLTDFINDIYKGFLNV